METRAHVIENTLATLLPPCFAVVALPVTSDPHGLMPEEAQMAASMSPPRRAEFAAGRTCARAALARLGLQTSVVIGRDGRAPVWPGGFTGSITHGHGVAAAALAPVNVITSAGVDLEPCVPLEHALLARIALPAERVALLPQLAPDELVAVHILFSAKESVYKCIAPLTGRFLEFADVELNSAGGGELRVRLPSFPELEPVAAAVRCAWRVEGDFVVTAAWLPADGDAPEAQAGGR